MNLKSILKLSLVALVLGWMIKTGKLDPNELKIFGEKPEILLFTIALWLCGPCLLGSLRWWLLLRAQGYKLSWMRSFWLQVVGFFFNSAMPGAVGGDVIKAFYVHKAEQQGSKTRAMVSVVMDRIIGLAGLFTMGSLFLIFSQSALLADEEIKAQTLVSLALSIAILCGIGITLYPFKEGRDPIIKFLSLPFPLSKTLAKIYSGFRSFQEFRMTIFYCLMLSILIQFMTLLFFHYLAEQMLGFRNLQAIATIFPIGIAATALPLAPGGLGVGQLAFDKLFGLLHVRGGGNIFNIYVIGQLSLNLLGVFPYLLLRRKEGSVPESEAHLPLSEST